MSWQDDTPAELSRRQGAELLGGVDRVRADTRRSLPPPWFALVCFGALTLGGAAVAAALGSAALGPWWLLAAPAGSVATHAHYQARSQSLGVTGRVRALSPAILTAGAACLLVAIVLGGTLGSHAAVLGPIAIVLAAYAGLGWVQRDPRPCLALIPGAAVASALAIAARPDWSVELAMGAGMVLAGAGLAVCPPRSA